MKRFSSCGSDHPLEVYGLLTAVQTKPGLISVSWNLHLHQREPWDLHTGEHWQPLHSTWCSCPKGCLSWQPSFLESISKVRAGTSWYPKNITNFSSRLLAQRLVWLLILLKQNVSLLAEFLPGRWEMRGKKKKEERIIILLLSGTLFQDMSAWGVVWKTVLYRWATQMSPALMYVIKDGAYYLSDSTLYCAWFF